MKTRLNVNVPTGLYARLKAHAKARGQTLTSWVVGTLVDQMHRQSGAATGAKRQHE